MSIANMVKGDAFLALVVDYFRSCEFDGTFADRWNKAFELLRPPFLKSHREYTIDDLIAICTLSNMRAELYEDLSLIQLEEIKNDLVPCIRRFILACPRGQYNEIQNQDRHREVFRRLEEILDCKREIQRKDWDPDIEFQDWFERKY